MERFYKVIISITLLLLFGCKQKVFTKETVNTDPDFSTGPAVINPNLVSNQDSEMSECVITHEEQKLRSALLPFEFKDFNIRKIRKYFSENVTVDSVKHNKEGTSYTIYTFKEGASSLSFFIKPVEANETWFYLDESTINNNLFKFKNNIKIGMPKKAVNKAFGLKENPCDTLHFQEGDLFIYYDFIFKNNRLAKINITPEE